MGNFFSIFKSREARICMVGLDAAGKTTVLFKLKLNEVATTIPTIGFNVEKVEYKNLKMTIWDIGGQDILRPLWKHYYEGSNGVIFVVDSCDDRRMELAAQELEKTMSDSFLADARLVVFANKQDLPQALSPSEIIQRLRLNNLKQKWFVQGTSATTGQGLYEGLDWLSANLPKKMK